MKRSGKSRKERRARKPVNGSSSATSAAPVESAPKSRSILRDILLGLVVCVAFFALVEGGLRLAGYPPVQPADDPFVGFSSVKPLYLVKDGVASTAPERQKFFNTVSFPVPKPPNTLRIFCFGGSTTYGHPYDASASFSRWLQDLLQASAPDKNIEVINAGGISYASYRIVPLVRETLNYKPDLMIFYMGHNEFLERRTYSKILDQGSGIIELRALLDRLYLYRALKKALKPFMKENATGQADTKKPASSGSGSAAARSKKSMLGEEVETILDKSGGLDLYYRDEAFTKGVVQHFGHNLEAVIQLCKEHNVPVIFVQPPSNLKDFSPFKSEHSPGFSASEKRQTVRQLDLARNALRKENFSEALASADSVIAKDPLYADAHYLRGKALLGLGRSEEAKESFVKAKDLDVCPLRCISPLEEQIKRVTSQTGIPLIDFKAVVERRCSETGDRTGIPGNESFLDHVHPTVALHQALAEMLVDEMTSRGLFHPTRKLSEDERQALFAKGTDGFDASYMASKDLNLAKTLHWAGKKEEATTILKRVVRTLDGDPEVHKLLGRSYLDEGKSAEAIEQYTRAVELSHNDPLMEFNLAVAYYDAGRKREAEELYRKLCRSESGPPQAAANLTIMCLEQGKVQEALEIASAAMEKHPDSETLAGPYALALAVSGKPAEAIPWMLKAVDVEPGQPKHLYNLAAMYALTGESSKALEYLNKAAQRGYADPRKLAADPAFRTIRLKPEFQALLDKMQ
jgi:Flp pilus assembly protein TadD/lysophospholipase L1-like esterase